MKTFENNSWVLGIGAAIGASLCCITPVLAFLGGFSGIASTFSWVEPIRPFLIGGTLLVFGFAWFQKLKPTKKDEIDCDCDPVEKQNFLQSKHFLFIVTIFSACMLALPYYSNLFYPENQLQAMGHSEQGKFHQVEFEVEGMTCEGCESHITMAVGELKGIKGVKASYETGNATVSFDPEIVSEPQISNAINETGYKVVDSKFSSGK